MIGIDQTNGKKLKTIFTERNRMPFQNRENNLRSLSGTGKLFVGHANKIVSLRRSIFSPRNENNFTTEMAKKLNEQKIKYNRWDVKISTLARGETIYPAIRLDVDESKIFLILPHSGYDWIRTVRQPSTCRYFRTRGWHSTAGQRVRCRILRTHVTGERFRGASGSLPIIRHGEANKMQAALYPSG